jgi:hypothetical protein
MPTQEKESGTRVPISFPDELYEWLRAAAFQRRLPMAEIVRQALREHREKTDPQLQLPIEAERWVRP